MCQDQKCTQRLRIDYLCGHMQAYTLPVQVFIDSLHVYRVCLCTCFIPYSCLFLSFSLSLPCVCAHSMCGWLNQNPFSRFCNNRTGMIVALPTYLCVCKYVMLALLCCTQQQSDVEGRRQKIEATLIFIIYRVARGIACIL